MELKGFSPLWKWRCVLSLNFLVKFWPHFVHPKGFSPLWRQGWLLRLSIIMIMYAKVHIKGFLLRETFSTNCTLKWFYFSMDLNMLVAVVVCDERLATYWTAERSRSTMHAEVHVKSGLLGETFTTDCTFKWFLSGMDTEMPVTVASWSEVLTTYSTAERFLANVHASMLIKGF